MTSATVIRLVTYSSVGGIIGWFANQHRAHVTQLRELAERDFLTGLLNTRAFDEALARRCASRRPFLLVLGDMDNLKLVNDAHGHTEGNRVLRSVAGILRGTVGRGGEVARVGGDEFGILIDANLEEATERCARFRRLLAGQGYDLSFGWAAMPDDGIAPVANSEPIAARVPHAELRLYEGGHAFFAQDPRALPDLMSFLTGEGGSS